MNDTIRSELGNVFQELARSLDILDTHYELAVKRYESIGKWLERPKSVVSHFEPEIFAQGSFSLGTMTKPISNEDEYDIDLVCLLDASKKDLSQKELKKLIGQELKAYAQAQNMTKRPHDRRRCWQMEYADKVKFHLDVLPSIPDVSQPENQSIHITDNKEPNYSIISDNWPCTNPADYAGWFKKQMEVQLKMRLKEFAEEIKRNVEEVPEYKVKTPLQRAVQILKRHRDLTYKGKDDDKPISILITTLAAKAYDNESNVLDAVGNIVSRMWEFIEEREVNGEQVLWVENPVNVNENFADKWQEYPERKDAFFDWLQQVELDIAGITSSDNILEINRSLEQQYGELAVKRAIEKTMLLSKPALTVQRLRLPAIPHKQRPSWPVKLTNNVEILAEVGRKGWRNKRIYNDSQPLPKNRSLFFTALTNLPKPFEVRWQITNTGEEAKNAGAMRGGFYESKKLKGRRIRNESTLYKGAHRVECFVIKDGVCRARSNEFIINIR